MRFVLQMTVAFAAAAFMAVSAHARPLDKKDCEALSDEFALLTERDIPKAIMRGPEWTLAHMPSRTMGEVKRYLTIEEQLRFRCSGKKPPTLDPEIAGAPGRQPEEKPLQTRAALAVEDSAVPADKNQGDGGEMSGAATAPGPAPPPVVRHNVQRPPATTATSGGKGGLDAAYKQLFPMGR